MSAELFCTSCGTIVQNPEPGRSCTPCGAVRGFGGRCDGTLRPRFPPYANQTPPATAPPAADPPIDSRSYRKGVTDTITTGLTILADLFGLHAPSKGAPSSAGERREAKRSDAKRSTSKRRGKRARK